MAMRWSSARRDLRRRPWAALPSPSTISVSPSTATATPQALEPVGDRRQPVAFLDPQFAEPAHHGAALGEGGGHGEDRIFVDHAGRALGRNLDAVKLARAHDPEIGHRLAALVARRSTAMIGAHLGQGRK